MNTKLAAFFLTGGIAILGMAGSALHAQAAADNGELATVTESVAVDPAVKAQADYVAAVSQIANQGYAEPKAAIAKAQQVLQDTPVNLVDSTIYTTVADIQARQGDVKGALATLGAGTQRLTSTLNQCALLSARLIILQDNKRGAEVLAILEDEWARAANSVEVRCYLLPLYVRALENNGKAGQVVDLCRRAVEEHLEDTNQEWLLKQFTKSLLDAGKEDEALGWAKLHFMTCLYDERSITDATKLLTSVWVAKSMSASAGQAFLKAQEEADAANPLKDVVTPVLDAAKVKDQLDALPPNSYGQRITILLNAGNYRQAMLRARSLLLAESNSSEGALQICRVFKARDLDLRRANAFLQYYKTGVGENPVEAFLKENPAPVKTN